MKVAIVANPIAGAGKAREKAPVAKEQLVRAGHSVTILMSTSAGASVGLARQAAADGCDLVVACGGDGTVLEVTNGIAGSRAMLGILPFGRGNDVSKDLGLPQEEERAYQALISGRPRWIDGVLCRGRYFLGVGGVGLDGQAAVTADRWKAWLPKKDRAYELVALWTMLHFQPFSLDITVDGKPAHFTRVYLVAVGNTSTYSAGLKILPKASFNDGLLDACVITSPNRFHTFQIFPMVYKGAHLQDPGVFYFQGSQLELACRDPGRRIYCFADGELFGTLPNSYSIAPKLVQILYPEA